MTLVAVPAHAVAAPRTAPVRTRPSQAELVRDLAETYAAATPVRSVAVLGNKPMEVDAARAAAIDACDLVVRVNSYATDPPEGPSRYGSRTDVVFFNRALRATPESFEGYSRRLHLLVEPGRLHWEPEGLPRWWPQDLGMVHLSNRELTLPLSDALGIPTRTAAVWATTGTMAAWWARTTFPSAELLLSGFSFLDDGEQTSWEHAVGDACAVGPEHLIAQEGALLRRWVDDGLVDFRR